MKVGYLCFDATFTMIDVHDLDPHQSEDLRSNSSICGEDKIPGKDVRGVRIKYVSKSCMRVAIDSHFLINQDLTIKCQQSLTMTSKDRVPSTQTEHYGMTREQTYVDLCRGFPTTYVERRGRRRHRGDLISG